MSYTLLNPMGLWLELSVVCRPAVNPLAYGANFTPQYSGGKLGPTIGYR